MLYQKIREIRRNLFRNRTKSILLLFLSLFWFCSGCGQVTGTETEKSTGITEDTKEQRIAEECETLAEGYRGIYEKAEEQGTLDTLEVRREIIEFIGSSGYAAVDREDQIDMVNYEQAEEFCKSADEGQKDSITIISLIEEGGFIRYDMETEEGEIDVAASTLRWREGKPRISYYNEFTAHTWQYTEKGYFFVEEYHPPGYDGAPGVTAFRVRPLDKACRELNRKYVYPVGYELNNMLITDWSEQDYSELDFYDMYDKLYCIKYGKPVPYEAYEGAEYEIPEQEFEEVLQSYFRVGREQLAEKTMYDPNSRTYLYRPRGLYELELPYGPYPEVVAYEEQEDGTIRLFIEAVWERKLTDKAGTSELVVRPLDDGGFQYVSNQVTGWDDNLAIPWYKPRLTDEEWRYYYVEDMNK